MSTRFRVQQQRKPRFKKSEKCFRLLSFEFDPFYIQVFNAHASGIFRVYSDDFGIESGEIPCFSRTVNTEWEKLRIKSALIGPSWTDILIALNLFRLRRNTEQPNTEHRWVVAGKIWVKSVKDFTILHCATRAESTQSVGLTKFLNLCTPALLLCCSSTKTAQLGF